MGTQCCHGLGMATRTGMKRYLAMTLLANRNDPLVLLPCRVEVDFPGWRKIKPRSQKSAPLQTNPGQSWLLQRPRHITDWLLPTHWKGTGATSSPISIRFLVSVACAVSAHEIICFPRVRMEQHFTTGGNLKAKQTH